METTTTIQKTKPNFRTILEKEFMQLTQIRATEFKTFINDTLRKKSRNTLNRWLSGQNEPAHGEKILIAQFFQVPVNQLFPEN